MAERLEGRIGELVAAQERRPAELAEIMDRVRPFASGRLGGAEAVAIVETVLGWLVPPLPEDGVMSRLRRILDIAKESRIVDRRGLCLELVAKCAQGKFPASMLITELEQQDSAFGCLREDPDKLASLLDRWVPTRARGKLTSASILATIIVEDCDALGFAAHDDESHEDAVTRIARQLAKATTYQL